MSGHSKWATIKHKKALQDQKRGKVFSQLVRQIQIAARTDPNPASNSSLRMLIDKAKTANMPSSNIDRAIKKASGQGEGATLEELTLEAYGPRNTAFLVESITDNHNRTVSEIKHIFERNQGHLAEKGSVIWLFEKKMILKIDPQNWNEELELKLIDAGIEDVQKNDEDILLLANPAQEAQIRQTFKTMNIAPLSEEFDWQAKNPVNLDEDSALKQVEELIAMLEDNEDTKAVYTNLA